MSRIAFCLGKSHEKEDAVIARVLSSISISIIASLLIITGFLHLANPYLIFKSILLYKILSPNPSKIAAAWLPFAHLFLGSAILFAPTLRKSAFMYSAFIFIVYIFAQLSVIYRGLDIPCGCFGAASNTESIGYQSLSVAFAGFILSFIGFITTPRFLLTKQPSN